jgi:hypothetical protein
MSRSGCTLSTLVLVALSSWSCGSTAPEPTPKVAAIVVSPSTPTLAIDAQLPLQAQVRDESGALVADAPITWTVEDPAIVSVSTAGVDKALAVGPAKPCWSSIRSRRSSRPWRRDWASPACPRWR